MSAIIGWLSSAILVNGLIVVDYLAKRSGAYVHASAVPTAT